MPLIKINANGARPVLDGSGITPDTLLNNQIANLPDGAPVVILVHGFKFSPFGQRKSPHDHILSLRPKAQHRKAVSWPKHLGFGENSTGLCIAFGWEARGSFWKAYKQAACAGQALARLIRSIKTNRPVHIVAHSLGARVALTAVQHVGTGSVGRVLLLAGAEYRSHALRAVQSDAGQVAEFVNITSRENDLFDFFLEWLTPSPRGDRALGHGLSSPQDNWLDLQMDDKNALAGMARLGFRIPPPAKRICHWSAYLRPGMFGLYRTLIHSPDKLTLPHLRSVLPTQSSPRWSRLISDLPPFPTLPFAMKPSS